MGQSQTAKLLRPLALGSALLLAAVRINHLRTAFDENGLLPPGSRALTVTVLLSAAVFLMLTLASLRLNRLPGTEDCFSGGAVWLFLRLAATVLLFCGCALPLLEAPALLEKAWRWTYLGGLLTALAMLWTALAVKRSPALFWFRLLLALFTGVSLVLRFREWSHDPMVIHIAPPLLAWVCCMMETMLLTGFPLKAGHRRSGVLFGLAAGVFACMTLVDYLLGQKSGLSEVLILLGVALWCVTAALELLRPQVQAEQPAPEAPQEQPAPEAPQPEPPEDTDPTP